MILTPDSSECGSFLPTVASRISQLAFDYLDGVAVVGLCNWITPPADKKDVFLPQEDWIIDTIHERILPLPGHVPGRVQTIDVILRRNQFGL